MRVGPLGGGSSLEGLIGHGDGFVNVSLGAAGRLNEVLAVDRREVVEVLAVDRGDELAADEVAVLCTGSGWSGVCDSRRRGAHSRFRGLVRGGSGAAGARDRWSRWFCTLSGRPRLRPGAMEKARVMIAVLERRTAWRSIIFGEGARGVSGSRCPRRRVLDYCVLTGQ